MNSEIESVDMADNKVDSTSFTWVVDSAIRSRTPSNLGESPVHSFSSVVDRAIRSRTLSNLGASPVHGLSSAVDRTTAAQLSQEVLNWTEHFAATFFSLTELKAATNNFSLRNNIGHGSFGVVYKGKFVDRREVAIKRGRAWPKRKGPCPFKSELDLLLCLHHKNLVGLVGYCEEKDERILVNEYMKNGSLYDHLHLKNKKDKGRCVFNSWKLRIKIALDASRGIEYLHNYANPPMIHGNIKSSNILFDASWTARVSDFGLSSMISERRIVGYLDPEYYGLNVLTAKSDVYGLGVVLLELLMGKRAIFKYREDGGTLLLSVVDVAVPAILAGYLVKILDPWVESLDVNETLAVELVAYTAIHCVSLEGQNRPTITDIVVNLERALAICVSRPS